MVILLSGLRSLGCRHLGLQRCRVGKKVKKTLLFWSIFLSAEMNPPPPTRIDRQVAMMAPLIGFLLCHGDCPGATPGAPALPLLRWWSDRRIRDAAVQKKKRRKKKINKDELSRVSFVFLSMASNFLTCYLQGSVFDYNFIVPCSNLF